MAARTKSKSLLHLVYPLRRLKLDAPMSKMDKIEDMPDDDIQKLVLLTFDEDFCVKLAVFPEKATTCRCKRFKVAKVCEHITPIMAWQRHVAAQGATPPDIIWVKKGITVRYAGENINKVIPILSPPEYDLNNWETPATGEWDPERVFCQIMAYSLLCQSVRTPGTSTQTHTIFEPMAVPTLVDAVAALEVLLNVSNKARESDVASKAKAKFARYRGTSELGKILTKSKCPKEDEFYVDPKTWVQSLYCLNTGSNVLLTGPSGCGKSELVKMVSDNAKRPFEAFNFGGMTEPRSSLIGNVEFTPEKGTFFSESRFVRAIQTPNTVVLLDEISRAPRDAFNILLPLLDGQRYLPLDESKENATVNVAKGVTFWATANEGMEYTGTSILDRALRDRFQVIDLNFMPSDKERQVLIKRCGIPADVAGYLVDIAHKQRLLTTQNDEFSLQISTRSLIAAGNQFAFGVPLCEALEYCVEGMFSADGDQQSERTAVRTIINKVIPVAELTRTID